MKQKNLDNIDTGKGMTARQVTDEEMSRMGIVPPSVIEAAKARLEEKAKAPGARAFNTPPPASMAPEDVLVEQEARREEARKTVVTGQCLSCLRISELAIDPGFEGQVNQAGPYTRTTRMCPSATCAGAQRQHRYLEIYGRFIQQPREAMPPEAVRNSSVLLMCTLCGARHRAVLDIVLPLGRTCARMCVRKCSEGGAMTVHKAVADND